MDLNQFIYNPQPPPTTTARDSKAMEVDNPSPTRNSSETPESKEDGDEVDHIPQTVSALSPEQQTALTHILEHHHNTILLGPAGTGKTYIVSCIQQHMGPNDLIITGTTGVSAVQYENGRTLHSAVKTIPINTKYRKYSYADVENNAKTALSKSRNPRTCNNPKYVWAKHMRLARCLVIDEISMCSAYIFTCLDISLRVIRERPGRPFGGMQIVVVGDLLQLPHVVDQKVVIPFEPECTDNKNAVYKANIWNNGRFYVHLLRYNFRQCDDPELRRILHDIRYNQNHSEVRERIHSRLYKNMSDEFLKESYESAPFIMLRWLKQDVRNFNNMFIQEAREKWRRIQQSSTPHTKSTFMKEYEFPIKKSMHYGYKSEYDSLMRSIRYNHNMFEEKTQEFFVGMHVMITRNNPTLGVVNGDHGVIQKFRRCSMSKMEFPIVRIQRKDKLWDVWIRPDKYSVQESNTDVVSVWVMSLMPCYAITIHKVQGVTFRDQTVVIDCKGLHRNENMFYVALSRACYLEKVLILNYRGFCQSQDAIDYYNMLNEKAQGKPLLLESP